MCGIAGIINLCQQQLNLAGPLEKMTKQMVHRGPDDEGYAMFNKHSKTAAVYYGENDIRGRPIRLGQVDVSYAGLAHRRLSILDLTNQGHQPFSAQSGRYWIVFNGEIYNYQEIGREIQEKGIVLQSKTDTEILLQAYILWGAKCLQKLNGDFAFAIWDHEEKCLFCARDRVGIKPFYYTIQNNQFIFASDIKTIIASGLYRPKISQNGLYYAMAFGMAPRPLTAFHEVYALEQGHYMIVPLGGKIQNHQYWSIPVGTQQKNMTFAQAKDLLEYELACAVKRRLVSDVPVGTFMSGGIDSTTVSAIAAQFHPGIKAFTLTYESTAPELDETLQAIATAKMHPLQHIVHKVNPDDALLDLQTWVDGYEEPFYTLAANFVISKVVKQNDVTVVLNGLGGDELFAGYGYYKYARFWPIIKWCAPFLEKLSMTLGLKKDQLEGLSHVSSPDQLHTLFFRKNTDTQLQKLFQQAKRINTVSELKTLYAKNLEFDDAVEAMSYMDLKNYIGNHHVHRLDQFTMQHSVEGRFPFLDHQLIEAAFNIPSKWKLQGGVQKFVLREVAKKYIHPSCLTMKKKGFGLPLKHWISGPLKSIVYQKLNALSERGLICNNGLKALQMEYLKSRMAPSKIWHLVALELWIERFIEQKSIY